MTMTYAYSKLSLALLVLLFFMGCATPDTAPEVDPISLDSAQIKMTIHDIHGPAYATIPVSFDGHKEICLLDTGAQVSLARNTPFFQKRTGSSRVLSWGASGRSSVTFLSQFKTVTIGGIRFPDRNFVMLDEKPTATRKYACVIGLDFFRAGAIVFNFKEKYFQILASQSGALSKWPMKNLSVSRTGQFSVPLTINAVPMNALWDSGWEITSIADTFMKAHPANFEFVRKIKSVDLHGGTMETSIYSVKNPVFPGLSAKETATSLDTKSSSVKNVDAVFGFNWMIHDNWIFDLRHGKWASF
jgi:hypothetical protein